MHPSRLLLLRRPERQLRADAIAVGALSLQAKPDPMVTVRARISEQRQGIAWTTDEHCSPPIVQIVSHGESTRDASVAQIACKNLVFGEPAISFIVQKLLRFTVSDSSSRIVDIVVDVAVSYDKIEMAIQVVVQSLYPKCHIRLAAIADASPSTGPAKVPLPLLR